ncbi:uncharacterized protein IL334_003461 [Kwoniella shivajii]|uniref:Uncharacterized protein n=1 Tax=Kwoniella shivajii TaxID=564305 RepID=A0ABZ1CXM8_9TREE|nr:hypothetical protein IL334_003461 [Kwoniella shivajii]
MSNQNIEREKLDIESSQARETRLGKLLSSITSPSAESPNTTQLASPPNPIPMKPSAVPESDVLARARAFLPMIQASNQELLARAAEDPDSVDIEKINGDHAIAMDLGLGVFDAPKGSKSDLGPMVNTQLPVGHSEDDDDQGTGESSESSSSSESESDSAEEETI